MLQYISNTIHSYYQQQTFLRKGTEKPIEKELFHTILETCVTFRVNQFTFYLVFNYFNLFHEDWNVMPDFQYVYNFQSIIISLRKGI